MLRCKEQSKYLNKGSFSPVSLILNSVCNGYKNIHGDLAIRFPEITVLCYRKCHLHFILCEHCPWNCGMYLQVLNMCLSFRAIGCFENRQIEIQFKGVFYSRIIW